MHKHTLIDGVGLSTWCHNFKTAAMMSYQGEKCHCLASKNEVSPSTHQFLVYDTFVLVFTQIGEHWDEKLDGLIHYFQAERDRPFSINPALMIWQARLAL